MITPEHIPVSPEELSLKEGIISVLDRVLPEAMGHIRHKIIAASGNGAAGPVPHILARHSHTVNDLIVKMKGGGSIQPLLDLSGSPAVFLSSCIEQRNRTLTVHLDKIDITYVP